MKECEYGPTSSRRRLHSAFILLVQHQNNHFYSDSAFLTAASENKGGFCWDNDMNDPEDYPHVIQFSCILFWLLVMNKNTWSYWDKLSIPHKRSRKVLEMWAVVSQRASVSSAKGVNPSFTTCLHYKQLIYRSRIKSATGTPQVIPREKERLARLARLASS